MTFPDQVWLSVCVQVVCGQDHSLFRTKKGAVFACGWGADGQTGRSSALLAIFISSLKCKLLIQS